MLGFAVSGGRGAQARDLFQALQLERANRSERRAKWRVCPAQCVSSKQPLKPPRQQPAGIRANSEVCEPVAASEAARRGAWRTTRSASRRCPWATHLYPYPSAPPLVLERTAFALCGLHRTTRSRFRRGAAGAPDRRGTRQSQCRRRCDDYAMPMECRLDADGNAATVALRLQCIGNHCC